MFLCSAGGLLDVGTVTMAGYPWADGAKSLSPVDARSYGWRTAPDPLVLPSLVTRGVNYLFLDDVLFGDLSVAVSALLESISLSTELVLYGNFFVEARVLQASCTWAHS